MLLISPSPTVPPDLAKRIGAVLAIGASLACGAAPRMLMHAPNPNGCYLMIFEAPGFEAANDVLNGPGRWPNLENLRETNYGNWANRIRSLRVGATATVTAFTKPAFGGQSHRYEPETDHTSLTPEFAARIQSLDIECAAAARTR